VEAFTAVLRHRSSTAAVASLEIEAKTDPDHAIANRQASIIFMRGGSRYRARPLPQHEYARNGKDRAQAEQKHG
jgi:hypothetical protein